MRKLFLTVASAAMLATACCSQAPESDEEENPVIETIMARRSIRYYTDTPVEREKLQKIAECGINAPNAMNKQEWEVRIVDSKEYLDGATEVMLKAMPFMAKDKDPKFRNAFRNASAIIAIACPAEGGSMQHQNVGLMTENICLAAYSLGLGTCVMGGPAMVLNTCEEAKPWLDKLGFSEGYELQVVIAVGYPDETPEARPRDASKIKFVD